MGGTLPEKEFDFDVLAGSAEVIDSCTDARTSLGAGWLGSAVFTATGSEIVVVNHQPYVNTSKAVSFEGAASGSSTLYLPTAMRDIYHNKQTTFYAIQNTSSSSDATVTINYVKSSGSGPDTSTQQATIGPLQKKALGPKSGTGTEAPSPAIPEGWIGSAELVATGATVVGITNIGVGAGNCPTNAGLATAFSLPSTVSAYYSLPYLHWSTTSTLWQSFIAVQNVGSSNASFTVRYYNQSGTSAWNHSFSNIAPTAKGVSYWGLAANPSSGTDFTGSVVVEGATGSEELVVLVTNQQATGCYGGSYVGLPFTP
jgi:hypothetical protein